jgi:hypothetical protein
VEPPGDPVASSGLPSASTTSVGVIDDRGRFPPA